MTAADIAIKYSDPNRDHTALMEAIIAYAKEKCEEQRKICLAHYLAREPKGLTDFGEIEQDFQDRILNAPEPNFSAVC